jgi:LacI family transcriptional regulator, gluconate utilization system Gnt-I transcriptional repressor
MKMTGKRITKRKITLKDVAIVANVSAITVSRVYRNPTSVSDALRERIQRVIAELGYVPDPAASALASVRTNVIGLIIPSITNNVFTDVMRGIYAESDARSFGIQIGNSRYSALEEERLIRVFLSQRPSGLIVTGIDQSDASLDLLRAANCPIVQIMDTSAAPVDMSVGFLHREAAEVATQHLLDCGYRKIAFFGAQMDPRTRQRLQGYQVTLQRQSIHNEKLTILTLKPSTVKLGSEMLTELLARGDDFDAVLCNNDDLAMGVLVEARRQRIQVPTKLGICGFNDLDILDACHPSITSIKTFREEMGRRAMKLIFNRLAEIPEEIPATVDLGYELKVRESTQPQRNS